MSSDAGMVHERLVCRGRIREIRNGQAGAGQVRVKRVPAMAS